MDSIPREILSAMFASKPRLVKRRIGHAWVYADRVAVSLFDAIVTCLRPDSIPVEAVTLLGDPEVCNSVRLIFDSVKSAYGENEGWRGITDGSMHLLWFYDTGFSYSDEVNFIVFDDEKRTVVGCSDLTRLYGRKQLSVLLASLILDSGQFLHIHGSSAIVNGEGVIFIGGARTGKSNLLREVFLQDPENVAPVTDNITLVDPTGKIRCPIAPFSDEWRMFSGRDTVDFLDVLRSQYGLQVDYYERGGKVRLSLSQLRNGLGKNIRVSPEVKKVFCIERPPFNPRHAYCLKGDPPIMLTIHRLAGDPGWIDLWSLCPVLKRVHKLQARAARVFYSGKNLLLYRLVLPEKGGEAEAARIVIGNVVKKEISDG